MVPFMALRLTHLELSHFRSHRRTELTFDGRPVVFAGANGAGKTNLLEAISLLSPGRGLRRAAIDALSRQPQGIGWKIRATITRNGTPFEIDTGAAPGQPRSLRIDDKPAAQSALGRIAPMLWLTPAMDRLWIEAPEGRRRFLDRMVLAFRPDHADAALAYEKAMRERNRLLRDRIGDSAWHGALEAQMAQAGARISANRRAIIARLGQATDEGGAFPAADLTLICDAPDDEAGLARALAANRRGDMAAGRSLLGPHRADLGAVWREKGMPAAQCSTGEQKALLLSLVLANARALAADTGLAPILLLDEVAAHLDAERRAALYDAICALGAQAFLTGTEPALFDALAKRAACYTVIDDGGSSRLTQGFAP
ncbi:MAG: DNA replication and repair protein RecF [Rhodobacteraceae bacterium HLUCCA12]|nr:MAG: DNA replication and repair protein RecF [Rhodobacteraceae bacterium HLUCCA12]